MARRIIITVEDENGEEISRMSTHLLEDDAKIEDVASQLETGMFEMTEHCEEWEENGDDEEIDRDDLYISANK